MTEGFSVSYVAQAAGFSYGAVPIILTPLACSDYPGNLSDLFTNIPPNSANPGVLYIVNVTYIDGFCCAEEDLVSSDPILVSVDLSSGFSASDSVFFNFVLDGLHEGTECLIVVLSVNETELHPRDQGQVEITDDVALVRILDGDIGK